MDSFLISKTLKEQVYDYLRKKIETGELKPGARINLKETSEKLGISKTPLRDALLQLEVEGFVTIKPRSGIVVNKLSLENIKDYYQIIGALESAALLDAKGKLSSIEINEMKQINENMAMALNEGNFELYYEYNLKLHHSFMKYCNNSELKHMIEVKRKRLYDFPRKKGFLKDWEIESIGEHNEIIKFLEEGDYEKAVAYLRDVHWSFKVQEKFIKEYYEF